ncbi:MAG: GIY-YIG nuclease family protein [Rhodobacteraceae bacterium]|nr:GIY-YIG nuclease family protein [Paracoccaceae bacterium]
MPDAFTEEDAALLAALGIEADTGAPAPHTAQEERIIAGFAEIQCFAESHGRPPQPGAGRPILERLHAVRLDRIRHMAEARALVEPTDHQGLLAGAMSGAAGTEEGPDDDAALLAELGRGDETRPITELRHVRSTAERRAAEDIANRQRCTDFDRFKPLFEQVQHELNAGLRETRPFARKAEIEQGRFFIVGGQKAYVAEKGDEFPNKKGHTDARLRVIFDNGTESDLLMRSLQRALHKDDAGRRITEPEAGPLFAASAAEGDMASGTIYVLRSMSDHPVVAQNRETVHKIGVTGGSVESRIAHARQDPTFLMADVEIVATYDLFNINRSRLENLIHRIFAAARLDIEITDRFGQPVTPREWFLVPIEAIEEAIDRIRDGSIAGYFYDPQTAQLMMR